VVLGGSSSSLSIPRSVSELLRRSSAVAILSRVLLRLAHSPAQRFLGAAMVMHDARVTAANETGLERWREG